MSITLRPYRSGGWEVDITIRLPDGSQYRERKRASRFSKLAAQRWAQDRERYLLQHGPPTDKEVPTLEAFAPRFVDGHARANRHKPSGIATVESILKWHLIPTLGPKRLDAITNELGGDAGLRLGEIVALEAGPYESGVGTDLVKTVGDILDTRSVAGESTCEGRS